MAKITADTMEAMMATVMSKTVPELMSQMVKKFESCLNKLLATFENKLKDRLEMVNGEIYSTNVRIDRLEKKLAESEQIVDSYRTEQTALRRELAAAEQRLEEQEQYSKRDNLVFHGIPEHGDEDTMKKVIEVCQRHFPSVNVQTSDISISHRLPTRASDKPKPIIVRFARRDVRQQIFRSKKQLKNTKLMVVEQLTTKRLKLVTTANGLVREGKLAGTWTNDGKVVIKLLNDETRIVNTERDLIGL